MLILTRKVREGIIIGDDIKVTFLGIHGRQVRLGIDAPDGITVHREEIYEKIQLEKMHPVIKRVQQAAAHLDLLVEEIQEILKRCEGFDKKNPLESINKIDLIDFKHAVTQSGYEKKVDLRKVPKALRLLQG